MSDDKKPESGAAAGIADGAKELVKLTYPDLVQPGAKEIGKTLQTIGRAVNMVLAPVVGMIWCGEQVKEWIAREVGEKLKNVPTERLATPSAHVAAPLLMAVACAADESELRDLFASLLAAAVDKATQPRAHPAFVQVIQQMITDEARLLRLLSNGNPRAIVHARFRAVDGGVIEYARNLSTLGEDAKCAHDELTPVYLDNLARLELVRIPEGLVLRKPELYEPIEKHREIVSFLERMKEYRPTLARGVVVLTEFGKEFCDVCVKPHDEFVMGVTEPPHDEKFSM